MPPPDGTGRRAVLKGTAKSRGGTKLRSAFIPRALGGCAAVILGAALLGVPLAQSASASPSAATGRANAGEALKIGKSECAANKAAGKMTYVSPFGFDATIGIIDVFAAEKLGYFGDMCLTVQFVTNSEDSTELVSAGTATTTNVGSAITFLVAKASGSDITAVATYGATSDTCILTRPTITTLKQLEGKTFGYHFVENAGLLAMLKAAGVDVTKVTMVNTSDYDPNQVVQGKIDSVSCYRTNEPLTLKAEGAKFNEFIPSQFGVTGTYNVEFFNTKFLKAHYSAAKDWMRADLHAVAYCSTHQAKCVSIEGTYAKAAGSTFTVAHETEVWALAVKLAKGHTLAGKGIGVESQAEWKSASKEVVEFHSVKKLPTLAKVETTKMVASLYHGKTLIWP
jgi:putative hydroxymethylpyrimidine transport system substrate-binding protein